MPYDNKNPYFNKGEGVYSEYLNSSILLSTMFEMVGQVNIPSNYTNGNFNNTETPQKARFMNIVLENNTTINNGDNLVANANESFVLNSKVILSLFKSWKLIKVEGSNVDVQISIKDIEGNLIENVSNNEDLTNYNIDKNNVKIEIKANNSCTITNIRLEVNTKKLDIDSSVKISQDQIIGLKEWENNLKNDLNNLKIGTDKLVDNSVTNVKIADNNITNAKIASNAGILLSKLQNQNIQGTSIPLNNPSNFRLSAYEYSLPNSNIKIQKISLNIFQANMGSVKYFIVLGQMIPPEYRLKSIYFQYGLNLRSSLDVGLDSNLIPFMVTNRMVNGGNNVNSGNMFFYTSGSISSGPSINPGDIAFILDNKTGTPNFQIIVVGSR